MIKSKVTFKGGINPPEKKELAEDKPIQALLPQGEVVLPLSQHIGAPAKACVKAGDLVKVGTKIADAGGFVSVPIHSSVSGKVKFIKPHRVLSGAMQDCITIDNDGLYEEEEWVDDDVNSLSKEEILTRIKDAGVVGMGGAGFPTHVKLGVKEPDKIKYILINAAECEPYITGDYRCLLEKSEELLAGVRIILSLYDNAEAYICIEDNKPKAIELYGKLLGKDPRVHCQPMKTKYPQGGERFLIKAVTGQEISSAKLPADVGCIVDNVQTAIAVYDAVRFKKPLTHRVVTVSGEAINEPNNYYVPCGISVKELEDASKGTKDVVKILSGGAMMGVALFDEDVPIAKTSGAITLLDYDAVSYYQESNCLNCGRCTIVCPERLVPTYLARYARSADSANFTKWYGMECVECGCCSFICPAHKPLAQSIKTMKQRVNAERRAAKGGK